MKPSPDFKADLARGHAGERYLMVQHPDLVLGASGERRWDLCLVSPADIKTVEVKCDSYSPDATPNFFLEQRTRVHGNEGATGTLLGGPWRAADHGVDVFVYLFHKPGRAGPSTAYWFYDVPTLAATLTERLNDYEVRRVRSARLTAVGVLVPRESLAHLYTKFTYLSVEG